MAQVTMELRNLIQMGFDLFDFDYEFDDPIVKQQIQDDVINYFYDYEIGSETPDMFKRKFQGKWSRIIGYYNKLHNTALLSYNPLINYRMSEAMDQLSTQKSDIKTNNSGSTNSSSQSTASDYPQQSISGTDYASGSSEGSGESSSTDTAAQLGQVDNSSEYSKTIEGLTGISHQDLINKERENLLRISDMIINEMKNSFILLY